MANTTFMDLTNKLLRRINEVEIVQADFSSVRGVQAVAKDAINASINEINMQEFEWPFNSATGSQVLTAGTEEYSFPSTMKSVDWDSFHLVADDALNTDGMHLKKIARDTRYKYLKNDDDNAGADGRNAPVYVYETPSKGFGLSPSPDEAYTVTYNYYTKPVQLSAYDSTSAIDTVYDEVIMQGALYHFYMFRDNTDQADRALQRFRQLINRMRTILINGQSDTMQSTMIVHGSSIGIMSNDYFRF